MNIMIILSYVGEEPLLWTYMKIMLFAMDLFLKETKIIKFIF